MHSRRGHALSVSLLCVTFGAVGCGDDGTEPSQIPPTGLYEPAQRYEVVQGDGAFAYTSTDPGTPERTVKLRVRFPKGAEGPLPVVVVMHGGGFNDQGQTMLADWGLALATSGYLAIHFSNTTDEPFCHCPALAIPADECTGAAFMKEVSEGGTLAAPFYTRPQDAVAILDRLDAIAATAGVTVDPQRVAVLGHSGGAHAVMALAGASIDVSPSVHAMPAREPRFKAYVANSPQGVGHIGMSDTSWDPIGVPVLIQTGRRDGTEGEDPPSRLDAFEHLDGPDVFQHFVDAAETQHDVFSLAHSPGVTGIELTLASTAIAFLDAYVLDRTEARAWLASDALGEATGGVSTLSSK